ncbi:selenoprotein S [Polymixia lowei]
MEDVEIVDVNDDDVPEMNKRPLENQDLRFVHEAVGDFLGQYGWCLLVLTVGVILLIQYLRKTRASQGGKSSSPEAVQDPMSVARRQEALEASRRRMQEELDAKAEQFREKQKQLEEQKRKQKIEMWESMKEGKTYKGNGKLAQPTEEASSSTTVLKPKTDRKPLRSTGYNPLAGDGGGSCSWRPGRRGPSSGG